MRLVNSLSRHLVLSSLACLLLACSSSTPHKATTFPFKIDQARVDDEGIKTVVIAHVNLGLPSRIYLKKEAPRIDAYVSAYLKKNGLKVLPQRDFEQRWNTAMRIHGNPVSLSTGKINMKAFARILATVRDEMRNTGLDAFIFTNLLELQTAFSGGHQNRARWDGVSRKPTILGLGEDVSANFDWAMPLNVASLQVSIYDMELKQVFTSRGGLDTVQAVDERGSVGRYIRRRDILENEKNIQEGIELAFYPFIKSENWPGSP